MSQGIFGVVDFSRGLDDPRELAGTLGGFLHGSGDNGSPLSTEAGRNFLLAMKRPSNGTSFRQGAVGRDRARGTAAAIHGEISNYNELSDNVQSVGNSCRGDVDAVLRLYERKGRGFVRRLNGLFTIAIVDERRSEFLLVNDRFGLAHQVYWTIMGGKLCFATHIKTLLRLPGFRRDLDVEAMNLFLKYAYIPSPRSIFRGVRKLPPGHCLVWRRGRAEVTPHWEFPENGNTVRDEREAVSRYTELLKNSLSRRLAGAGRTGILLSGGLDSSANVALAAECSGTRLKTFAVGFENKDFDERPYARIVAEHFGAEHFECSVTGREIQDLPALTWSLEEPYFELGLFLTYRGLAAARGEADVVIGGEGADQLFGTGGFAGGLPAALHYLLVKCRMVKAGRAAGRLLKGKYFYEHDNRAFKARLLWNRAVDLNNWYFYGYDEAELRDLYRDPSMAGVPKIFPDMSTGDASSFPDLYSRTQIDQDLKHYVNENVMVKSGRMADMLGITLRESYLDTEVADFLVSMDYRFKRGGSLGDHLRGKFTTKLLHRRAMEEILPREILEKPKQGGFVPVMIFLKDAGLRQRIYRRLLASPMLGEYFRTDYLQGLFRKYESVQGNAVHWPNYYNSKANRILFLLTLDIWHGLYMNNGPGETAPPTLDDHLDSDVA